MLSIAHATTGALIATQLPNPYLSIPLILASHYVLDAVPHWDAGTGLSEGTKQPHHAFKDELVDLTLAGLLVIIWFQKGALDLSLTGLAPYWGAFVGLLPDFLEAPRNFLGKEPHFLRPINRFHHRLHHSIKNKPAGIAPQLILLYLIYTLK